MTYTPGQVIGAWQILQTSGNSKYLCLCTGCGVTTKYVRASDLRLGKSLMCRKCASSKEDSQKPPLEYNSWLSMKDRCLNPNCKDYPDYGGRGIKIHPLWVGSFEVFLMYVGKRPNPKYTIERLDVNGNYEPGNVKWVSRAEQTRNQRSNVNLTINGETKTVSEWSEHPECTVSKFTIYKRIKSGWSHGDAVFLPSKARDK